MYKLDIAKSIGKVQFLSYEIEGYPLDFKENLIQFQIVSILYAIGEKGCSENSSRLRSMDSAVKNCNEMSKEYELIYQGLRKSKITNELIIAAGAAKMAKMNRKTD